MRGFQEYMLKKIRLTSKSILGQGDEEQLAQAIHSKEWASAWRIAAEMAVNNPQALSSAIKKMPEGGDAQGPRAVLQETASNEDKKNAPAMLINAMVLDGEERALSLFLKNSSEVISSNDVADGLKMAMGLGYDKLALAMAISSPTITVASFQEHNLVGRVASKGPEMQGRGLAWALTFATKQCNDFAGVRLLQAGGVDKKSWAPASGSNGEPLLISMISRGKGMENSAALLIDAMASRAARGKVESLEQEHRGETALTEAIRVGNERLGQKIAELVSGEELLTNGGSPLIMALEKGRQEIVSTILFNVVRKARKSGRAPRLPGEKLVESAENCNQSVLASVIRAGAELDEKRAVDLLHFAINNGHRELASAIIARATKDGALIDKVGSGTILEGLGPDGLGPLAAATNPRRSSFNGTVVAELLAAGASGSLANKQLEAWAARVAPDGRTRTIDNDEWLRAKKAIERLNARAEPDDTLRGVATRSHAECIKFLIPTSSPLLHNGGGKADDASKAKIQLGSPPDIERVKDRLKTRAATSRTQINEALLHTNPRNTK